MENGWRIRWLEAQGYSHTGALDILGPLLFVPFPPQCCVCGDPWRPDKPDYVSVFGRIVRWGNAPAWYCAQLDFLSPTGHLDDHPRKLCREHGDRWPRVRDCLTNEWVGLVPPLTKEQKRWRDVQHWALTVLRFVWSYASEWFTYATHPIKAYKWFKARRDLGL